MVPSRKTLDAALPKVIAIVSHGSRGDHWTRKFSWLQIPQVLKLRGQLHTNKFVPSAAGEPAANFGTPSAQSGQAGGLNGAAGVCLLLKHVGDDLSRLLDIACAEISWCSRDIW